MLPGEAENQLSTQLGKKTAQQVLKANVSSPDLYGQAGEAEISHQWDRLAQNGGFPQPSSTSQTSPNFLQLPRTSPNLPQLSTTSSNFPFLLGSQPAGRCHRIQSRCPLTITVLCITIPCESADPSCTSLSYVRLMAKTSNHPILKVW